MMPTDIQRLILAAVCAGAAAVAGAQVPTPGDGLSRAELVEVLRTEGHAERGRAAEWAERAQVPLRGRAGDVGTFEIVGTDRHGYPRYVRTMNVDAAISTNALAIRNFGGLSVTGQGLPIGVWDAGALRLSHREFTGRGSNPDGAGFDFHATHVAGTLAAAGISSAARGMAPSATLLSFDWTNDTAEMASVAARFPGPPETETRILVSNHSYGAVTGWDFGSYSGNQGWHFFGLGGFREDPNFGRYSAGARAYDQVAVSSPAYLIFKSAGNDRDDRGPSTGQPYWQLGFGGWTEMEYDPATSPLADGGLDGFDTITQVGTAKNIMTVGAVDDAVTNGTRNPARAFMAPFSGWGPADDGRIKPDIVANGISLFSPGSASDQDYLVLGGTSMSSPNAAGTALLIQEYYARRLSPTDGLDGFMRAATLKGLIIHTADDLGRPGPDYSFGWGLMNALAAAEVIDFHARFPQASAIVESRLVETGGAAREEYTFLWDGASDVRATISWTELPGVGSLNVLVNGLNNRTPALINDLDLRITAPDGTVFEPWVLDPDNPSAPAVTGDNFRDNVEQVFIPAGSMGPGLYSLSVEAKALVHTTFHDYSLVLSGQGGVLATIDEVRDAVVGLRDGEPRMDANGDGVIDASDVRRTRALLP